MKHTFHLGPQATELRRKSLDGTNASFRESLLEFGGQQAVALWHSHIAAQDSGAAKLLGMAGEDYTQVHVGVASNIHTFVNFDEFSKMFMDLSPNLSLN